MALAEAVNYGSGLAQALKLVCNRDIPHELNIDSKALFDSLTSQHEQKDFRLRQVIQEVRASYETGEVSTLRWIAGKINPADALTKRNATTGSLLNRMCTTGRLTIELKPEHATAKRDTAASSLADSRTNTAQ